MKTENLGDVITSVIYYWRIFGLFPYTRVKGRYRYSPVFYCITFSALILVSFCTLYHYRTLNYTRLPITQKANFLFGMFLMALSGIYNLLLVYSISPQVKDILEKLEDVDRSLRNHGFVFKRNIKTYRYAFLGIGCLLVIYVELKIFIITPPLHVVRWFWVTASLQMIDLLYLLHIYFRVLVDLLRPECTVNQLQCLVISYDHLCRLASTFHELFGLSLLMVISHIFIFAVSQFFAIVYLSWNKDINLYRFIVVFPSVVSRLFFLCFILMGIVVPSAEITHSTNEFSTLLYQLLLDDNSNLLSDNKRLELHIYMRREVDFTAFGFFTIDYALLHTILAAVTTYLVILIQLGPPTRSDSGHQTTHGSPPNTTDVFFFVTTVT